MEVTPMEVTLILADSAQVADGKLFVLGGGWSYIGPGPAAMAVAAIIEVPWDEANVRQHFVLSLLDEDGMPFPIQQGDGTTTAVTVDGEFEVGRPAGSVAGSPINFPLALNFGGIPLPADKRLVWSFAIGQRTWDRAFTVRSE